MRVWTGECHVHAALRPDDVQRMRDEHPDADMLIHPECGCTTAVMEYLSHGDIDSGRTRTCSRPAACSRTRPSSDAKEFIVATETGMIHPLEEANPDKEFIPLDRKAVCQYMKMITLPKVRDALLDETGAYEVKVPEDDRREGPHPDRADDLDHPLAGSLTCSRTSAARSGRVIGPSSTNSKHASVRCVAHPLVHLDREPRVPRIGQSRQRGYRAGAPPRIDSAAIQASR